MNILSLCFLFEELALWADAFYKSKCPYRCVSVCPCVCSLLRHRLNVFLPPLSEVECLKLLEIQNPWGKKWEEVVSDSKTFTYKGCKIAGQTKVCFGANFAILNRIFLVLVFLTPFTSLFAPTSQSPMSKLFRFLESLGKTNGKMRSKTFKLLLIKGVQSPR